MYLCKLLRTIFWQSFYYQFSTSTTWPSINFSHIHIKDIRQSFPLLICTWFLKSLVYESDFWTWFFVYIFRTGFLKATQAVKIQLKNPVQKSILWTRDFKNQVQIIRGIRWSPVFESNRIGEWSHNNLYPSCFSEWKSNQNLHK